MASDRARISYDRKQQYRSVVMQQGRVTVEADWNEAQLISSEETREEALDFVGPAGTPDNGYAITLVPSSFDFQIGPGTMYVGGERTFLPQTELYSQQSDWLDSAIDPAWIPLPTAAPAGNEYVYLFLREQEVSGVEDSDLKDVALGGPDTAQRTRLIQHVERLATTGTDCPSALAASATAWAASGFALDTTDMRVRPFARLQVQFVPTAASTPCDPTAQGGYLGADNQLIRVQISNAANGALRLLWGFDDASFLYRVTVTDPQTLTLQTVPVDAEHVPQGGQAVEVLMDAARLSNGQYVAAPTGQVFTLATSSYNSDLKTLSLPSALNTVYAGTSAIPAPPQVYLRVWEQELTFTSGTAVTLGSTGVQVVLTSTNSEPFRVGDFWMFAVRPGTPQQVYPEKYLTGPQPPDGPREWICPLAVILWPASPPSAVNCRNPFNNLVTLTNRKLGGCCTVNVSPSDITGSTTLQSIVNQYSGLAGVNVCLAPGTYTLANPLLLNSSNSHVHFEACAGGVIIAAAATSGEASSAFLQGLVVLNSVTDVSFEGIQFQLPLVPVGSTAGPALLAEPSVIVSIGVRPVNSTGVRIENCQFAFNSSDDPLVAVGILAAGSCSGLQLEGNSFEMPSTSLTEEEFRVLRTTTSVVIGFGLMPTIVSSAINSTALLTAGATAQVVPATLLQAVIRDNSFSGLTLGTLVYGEIGLVQMASNTVQGCSWGFWFLTLPALAYADSTADISTAAPYATKVQALLSNVSTALQDPSIQLGAATLRGFPLPQSVDLSKAISVTVPSPKTPVTTPVPVTPVRRSTRARVRSGTTLAGITTSGAGSIVSQASTTPASGIPMLNQNFAIVEKLAFPLPVKTATPLALHIDANDASVSGSGLGLLVWDLGTNDQDAVNLTGDTFIANGALPVVLIMGPTRCMCTGNLVVNEATGGGSLWLYPLAIVVTATDRSGAQVPGVSVFTAAVTGNVFRGPAELPARNLSPAPPAPMNTWAFFNSET